MSWLSNLLGRRSPSTAALPTPATQQAAEAFRDSLRTSGALAQINELPIGQFFGNPDGIQGMLCQAGPQSPRAIVVFDVGTVIAQIKPDGTVEYPVNTKHPYFSE